MFVCFFFFTPTRSVLVEMKTTVYVKCYKAIGPQSERTAADVVIRNDNRGRQTIIIIIIFIPAGGVRSGAADKLAAGPAAYKQ